MDDWVGTGNVIDKQRLRELSERRNGPAALYLASHVGAIGVTTMALYYTAGSWWCVPFFCLQGVLLNFLYAPEHECDHFTAFKSRWLNVWVARLCGFFIILCNDTHRWSHYCHHKNTQNWDKDPELLARKVIRTPWQYLWALFELDSIWGKFKTVVLNAIGRGHEWHVTPMQKAGIERWSRLYVAGYATIFMSALMMQSWWPIYYWLGPFFAMRWTYWLQGLGEHICLTHEPHNLLNTRTFKTNAFMRWLNWNMTYHTVHHTYPSVPFYKLPELHAEIEAKLGFALPTSTYFDLHWGHLRQLLAGNTELDLCAAHDKVIRQGGQLRRITGESAAIQQMSEDQGHAGAHA